MRYLKNSYSWDQLLKKICFDLKGNDEFYFDTKANHYVDGNYQYESIASDVEIEFNRELISDRNGKFKDVNDIFYENMENNVAISRFKIYVSMIFKKLEYRQSDEVTELKKSKEKYKFNYNDKL